MWCPPNLQVPSSRAGPWSGSPHLFCCRGCCVPRLRTPHLSVEFHEIPCVPTPLSAWSAIPAPGIVYRPPEMFHHLQEGLIRAADPSRDPILSHQRSGSISQYLFLLTRLILAGFQQLPADLIFSGWELLSHLDNTNLHSLNAAQRLEWSWFSQLDFEYLHFNISTQVEIWAVFKSYF